MKAVYLKDAGGFLDLGRGELGMIDLDNKIVKNRKYAEKHAFIPVRISDISSTLENDEVVTVTFQFKLDDLLLGDPLSTAEDNV